MGRFPARGASCCNRHSMKAVAVFLFVFIASLSPGASFAINVDAPVSWMNTSNTGISHTSPPFPYSTKEAACLKISSSNTGPITAIGTTSTSSYNQYVSGVLYYFTPSSDNAVYGCSYSSGSANGTIAKKSYCTGSAPTLVSGKYVCQTSCPAPTVEVNGKCEEPVICTLPAVLDPVTNTCKVPCPSAGTIFNQGYYDLGTSDNNYIGDGDPAHARQACDPSKNCETEFTGDGSPVARSMQSGFYHYYAKGQYSYSGESCTTSNPIPQSTSVPPESACTADQQRGEVNGVTVCLPKTKTDDETTTTSTDPATGDKIETTTKDLADGSKETTVKRTHKDPVTGEETITITKTITAPTNPFCEANPTDPTCVNPSDFCVKNPNAVSCATFGEDPEPVEPETSQKSITFAPVSIAKNATCPTPLPLTVGGVSIPIEFNSLCSYASTFRPLVLALAYLSGLLIVASAFKE